MGITLKLSCKSWCVIVYFLFRFLRFIFMAKLLFFTGSAKKQSMTHNLAEHASELAIARGADVKLLDMSEYEMPLYNADYEQEHGIPEAVLELKQEFCKHHGFFIVSPEYNSSFTPLLKNTIDWISRPANKEELPLIAFKHKTAALASCSPGYWGGIRGLAPLRMMLQNIGVITMPTQIAIAGAHTKFDDTHKLIDAKDLALLHETLDELITITTKLNK